MSAVETTTPDGVVPSRGRQGLVAFKTAQARYPIVQSALLVIAIVWASTTLDGFTSAPSIRSLLVLAALVGLAAVGPTLLLLIGGLDLSVVGVINGSVIAVTQLPKVWGVPFGVAVLLTVVTAALLCGAAGWISHRYDINPLITTLGISSIAGGLASTATKESLLETAPPWLGNVVSPIGRTFGVGIPPIVAIWVGVGVLVMLFLYRTPTGRRLYATGSNPRAADLALVNTRRVWMVMFAASGAASALVGVLIAGFAGSPDPTLGTNYLFLGLAAVIVGGTLLGGPGDYVRTMIAAVLLVVLDTLLIGNGLDASNQKIVYGVAILLAVLAQGRERRVGDRI